uniref:Uncharacterized protein n=1 Tax=Panagrolaimus superbus TaxID=310955 RepID=A0A914YK24_9BILA
MLPKHFVNNSNQLNQKINIPAGFGISLVNNTTSEELIYARFRGVQIIFCRVEKIYIFSGHVLSLQVDNQLLNAETWHFLYCQVNALKGKISDESDSSPNSSLLEPDQSSPIFPAIKIEISYTPMEDYDAVDCFRIKFCDMCMHIDEILLWKLVQFYQDIPDISSSAVSLKSHAETISELTESDAVQIRKCYFGTLDLEFGKIALTVLTVAKSDLPTELDTLKRQFQIKLVSFENAIVSLPPFHRFRRAFESFEILIENLTEFYMR